MIISQKKQKTPGIGTELYVYKEDELTEEDQAEIYTKWTAFAGSLSVSPSSFKYRRSKRQMRTAKIYVYVYGKS